MLPAVNQDKTRVYIHAGSSVRLELGTVVIRVANKSTAEAGGNVIKVFDSFIFSSLMKQQKLFKFI